MDQEPFVGSGYQPGDKGSEFQPNAGSEYQPDDASLYKSEDDLQPEYYPSMDLDSDYRPSEWQHDPDEEMVSRHRQVATQSASL